MRLKKVGIYLRTQSNHIWEIYHQFKTTRKKIIHECRPNRWCSSPHVPAFSHLPAILVCLALRSPILRKCRHHELYELLVKVACQNSGPVCHIPPLQWTDDNTQCQIDGQQHISTLPRNLMGELKTSIVPETFSRLFGSGASPLHDTHKQHYYLQQTTATITRKYVSSMFVFTAYGVKLQ